MHDSECSKMEGNTIMKPHPNDEEPFEGMELESEDSAISFYMNYASRTGFRTRISRYCRSKNDNSIISRQIICSKAGFHQMKATDNEISNGGKPKRRRTVTKVGCKAMIEVKRSNNGKWVVTKFEKEHNHALSLLSKKRVSESQEIRNETPHSNRVVLYEQLYDEAVKYAEQGSVTDDIYEIAIAALREASEKVSVAKREVKQKLGLADSSSINSSSTETSSFLGGDGLEGSSYPDEIRTEVQGLDKVEGAASTSLKNAEAAITGSVAQVPVTVRMPITESLPATASSGGPNKVVAGPIKAMPVSSRPGAPLSSPLSKMKESRVHATAIACGARVIPPDQAVSLVKLIEAKIRSGEAITARSDPFSAQITGDASSSDETGENSPEP